VGDIVDVRSLTKTYDLGRVRIEVLKGITLAMGAGEFVAVMGPSGSGKSTLMNIVGCLDGPTAGTYALAGIRVETFTPDQLAEVRNKKIGFVFQTFNLLPRFTALKNVELPLTYYGMARRERRERAFRALEAVELGPRAEHKPNELSGGERQRVAIARALVNEPAILLADEPTGNLDSRVGQEIIRLFQRLNRERGLTIVMVTHDRGVAEAAGRILHLLDGVIHREERGSSGVSGVDPAGAAAPVSTAARGGDGVSHVDPVRPASDIASVSTAACKATAAREGAA